VPPGDLLNEYQGAGPIRIAPFKFYRIHFMLIETTTKDIIDLEEITSQVLSIKEFPCTLKIYDRLLQLANKDEARLLYAGLQVGWMLKDESIDTVERMMATIHAV
jgi:hypothetical protein